MPIDLNIIETGIITAALAGARIIRNHLSSEKYSIEMKTSHSDLVTDVDFKVTTTVKHILSRFFPDIPVISEDTLPEEERGPGNKSGSEKIYVDPIDGTLNFVHGYGEFAISIGYWHDTYPVAGVVINPFRNDFFTGIKGQGAFWNDLPLKTSSISTLQEAMLATGWPFKKEDTQRAGKVIIELCSLCQEVRIIGSAALGICYVAAGLFDGYWEENLGPWDMAGAAAIASEAGARITDAAGGELVLSNGSITVSNGLIHDMIVETTRKLFFRQ